MGIGTFQFRLPRNGAHDHDEHELARSGPGSRQGSGGS
jgi:hypothetical protein